MILAYGILVQIDQIEDIFDCDYEEAIAEIEAAGYAVAQNEQDVFIYDEFSSQIVDNKNPLTKIDHELFDREENLTNLSEYSTFLERPVEFVCFQNEEEHNDVLFGEDSKEIVKSMTATSEEIDSDEEDENDSDTGSERSGKESDEDEDDKVEFSDDDGENGNNEDDDNNHQSLDLKED